MDTTRVLARELGKLDKAGQTSRLAEFFAEAELFYGHGTDAREDEAAWLVDAMYRALPRPRQRDIRAERMAGLAVRRVADRRPLAYLLGEAWFCDLCFYVDDRVLIPRSPLGELIQAGFKPWYAGTPRTLLDLGTGSGCIAIAAYVHGVVERADAVDISPDALAVAATNVARFDAQSGVRLIESDLFAGVSGERYDLIAANPPYVPTATMAALPQEYAHEPALGLAAGELGLDFAVRILTRAAAHLNPGGLLLLEVGEAAANLEAQFPEIDFCWLTFDAGGDGVLAMTTEQVREYWPES